MVAAAMQISSPALYTRSASCILIICADTAAVAGSVHMTGTSAAVPQGALPSKSFGASGDLGSQAQAEAAIGISQRAASQRATSFVGTADYVAPEVSTIMQ